MGLVISAKVFGTVNEANRLEVEVKVTDDRTNAKVKVKTKTAEGI